MSVQAQERLLMFHSHLRPKDDTEFVDSFPFMNSKDRAKYATGFQAQASRKTDEFPLNDSLPLTFTPWTRSFTPIMDAVSRPRMQCSSDEEEITTQVKLLTELVDKKVEVVTFEEESSHKSTTEDADHWVVVLDEVSDDVEDFISQKGAENVSIIALEPIDFHLKTHIILYNNYLISTCDIESEKLQVVEDKEIQLENKYIYEIL